MVNLQGMSPKDLAQLESRLRGEIAKTEKKREKARREILAIAKRYGFSVQELFDVPTGAARASTARPAITRVGRPKGSGTGKPHAASMSATGRPRALSAPKSASKSKPVKENVSEEHKTEVRGLPTIAAKVRALLPHGYSRNAIATALGTTYQNVYQAERTPTAKAKAKPGDSPKASAKTKSRTKTAKRDVSEEHKREVKDLPTIAAKVRALLPHGYSRNAIAAALGTTYQNVYQTEKASKPKKAGK